jgi:16S rRNA (uracil1498-N3)-methyltransferase
MLFYLTNIDSGIINSKESDHFFSMRVKQNQILKVSNLKGFLAEIKISEINKKERLIKYQILNQKKTQKPGEKILYQAILEKNYLEKLVEVCPLANITEINLFHSEFSVKQKINLERLQKILIRSCEQSENLFLPKLNILEKAEILEKLEKEQFLILQKNSKENFKLNFSTLFLNTKNPFKYKVLVGPEGGWSNNELTIFENKKLLFLELKDVVYPGWLAGFVFFSQQI